MSERCAIALPAARDILVKSAAQRRVEAEEIAADMWSAMEWVSERRDDITLEDEIPF